MISANGKNFITLEDVIMVDGKQAMEAYANGAKVYPEQKEYAHRLHLREEKTKQLYSAVGLVYPYTVRDFLFSYESGVDNGYIKYCIDLIISTDDKAYVGYGQLAGGTREWDGKYTRDNVMYFSTWSNTIDVDIHVVSETVGDPPTHLLRERSGELGQLKVSASDYLEAFNRDIHYHGICYIPESGPYSPPTFIPSYQVDHGTIPNCLYDDGCILTSDRLNGSAYTEKFGNNLGDVITTLHQKTFGFTFKYAGSRNILEPILMFGAGAIQTTFTDSSGTYTTDNLKTYRNWVSDSVTVPQVLDYIVYTRFGRENATVVENY